MSFNYSKVEFIKAQDNKNYFIDSNIWLKVLSPKLRPSRNDILYRTFFDSITKNTKSKIVVPALVLSEVINRILREVYYGKHIATLKKSNPSFKEDTSYYKNIYRQTEDFKIAYTMICDEIRNYHASIILINDSLGQDFSFKHILKDPPAGLDFNDYFYYQLCKKRNYILVTDDKDFWVENVEVLTQSKTLYDKFIAQQVPK